MSTKDLLKGHSTECRFCSLLTGATSDVFESIWLEDMSYKAMVSVGALVPGWTLISPVSHTCNLASVYASEAFWEFTSKAAAILERTYGECVMFEHGAAHEQSLTGCGVGHAHLHLVPLAFSLEAEVHKTAEELTWTKCKSRDVAFASQGQEYLFVADKLHGGETAGMLCLLQSSTSQFFRRLIANRVGIGDFYDYKKFPMLDMASASARELCEQSTEVLGLKE